MNRETRTVVLVFDVDSHADILRGRTIRYKSVLLRGWRGENGAERKPDPVFCDGQT